MASHLAPRNPAQLLLSPRPLPPCPECLVPASSLRLTLPRGNRGHHRKPWLHGEKQARGSKELITPPAFLSWEPLTVLQQQPHLMVPGASRLAHGRQGKGTSPRPPGAESTPGSYPYIWSDDRGPLPEQEGILGQPPPPPLPPPPHPPCLETLISPAGHMRSTPVPNPDPPPPPPQMPGRSWLCRGRWQLPGG